MPYLNHCSALPSFSRRSLRAGAALAAVLLACATTGCQSTPSGQDPQFFPTLRALFRANDLHGQGTYLAPGHATVERHARAHVVYGVESVYSPHHAGRHNL